MPTRRPRAANSTPRAGTAPRAPRSAVRDCVFRRSQRPLIALQRMERFVEGPFPCLLIRGGKASECQAALTTGEAQLLGVPAEPDLPPVVPYSEVTEVWQYGTFVHVRFPEGEARFDVGDRRRGRRLARLIEDAPSPLE